MAEKLTEQKPRGLSNPDNLNRVLAVHILTERSGDRTTLAALNKTWARWELTRQERSLQKI